MRPMFRSVWPVAFAAAGSWVCLSEPVRAQAWTPVTINFDTASLATSGNTPASGVKPYNGGVTTLTDSNVFVSFLGASGLTATIGSGTLSYSTSGTWSWTTGTSGTTTYTSIMSQSFSIADLKSQGLKLVDANASRMYLSYGTNAYNQSAQPASGDGGRYSFVELNYKTNNGNGVDLSNIEQFSGSLAIESRDQANMLLYAAGNSLSTQELMSELVTAAGGTAAGPTWVPLNGSDVIRVTGPSNVANVASPFTNFQPYLAGIHSGSATPLTTPTMTPLRDPYSPQATPGFRSGTAVGALNWSGAAGFTSSPSPSGTSASQPTPLVSGSTYNTAYFFTPTVTQSVVGSGTYYGLLFSGSVSVINTAAAADSTTPDRWYTGLTINVNTGTDGSAINSFLQSGGPTSLTDITLSGSDWSTFSTDFSLASGAGNAPAAAPTSAIAGGGNSQFNYDYGQVVQKVIGDFQEGLNAGLYANALSGTYNYWLFSNGAGALSTSGTVGVLPSSLWFQNPQFAYTNTGSGAQNTFGAVIWNNSYQVTSSGSYAYGGVYGSPFDDRFGSPYIGSFGNTFPLDANGGSLTVRLNEAIAAVPEPMTTTLLGVGVAAAGWLTWRRRPRSTPPAA